MLCNDDIEPSVTIGIKNFCPIDQTGNPVLAKAPAVNKRTGCCFFKKLFRAQVDQVKVGLTVVVEISPQ